VTAVEDELRAAREQVLHDPPAGATERVAAAIAAAQPRRPARRRRLRSVVRAGPLPASMSGPTVLDVALTIRFPTSHHASFHVDCARPADARACDSVLHDRYALLAPTVTDMACSSPGGSPEAEISGQVGGVAVRRSYSGCYAPVTLRWIADLNAAGVIDPPWPTG
jgi:hypothetical protein